MKEENKYTPANSNDGNPKYGGEYEGGDQEECPNWPVELFGDALTGHPGLVAAALDNDLEERGHQDTQHRQRAQVLPADQPV